AGVRTLINVDLAENYMRQGRLLEAEIIARDQLMVVFTGTIPGWLHSASRARVLRLYSQILFEQGRFTDARIVARAAVLAHRVIRDDATSVSLNECRQILARTHLALGDWEAASQVYTLVQRDTRAATGFVADRFARDPDMALTFLVAGKYQEARDIFEKALEKAVTEKADAYAMGELQALYAAALAATGEKANAEKKFRETLPRLIAAAGARNVQLRNLVTTRKRLAVVLEAYLDLLSEKSTRPEPAALSNAFRLAEMAKSQTVQRSVVLSSVRAAARDPELARMVRKEQDTLKRMETMRGSLINAVSQPVHKQDITVINDLRERLLGIEKSGRDLRDEIERRFPRYGELTTPQPPDIDRVRSVLKPDEAMLVYFIGHSHSWVWAVPAEGEVAFARVKAGHNKVREMVATVRKSLDPQITRLDELPPFDLAAAYTLYQNFLAPVEAAWSQSRHLLVVPHGPLGYLPFAVLPVRPGKPLGDPRDLSSYRDTDWLVRSHRISTLPSVTTGVALRSQPEPPPRSRIMAAFANPVFDAQQTPEPADTSSFSNRDSGSPERVSLRAIVATEKLMSADLAVLPPLPETADEVLSMAQVVGADPQRDVFLGSRATEQRVKTMDLTPYRILVFATHGLKPGDLDGLLQPALALSSPAATHSAGNGFLTMGEILGLRLNADWVILSACNTGAGDGAASEALSGLGQAFFYAGARALLVSNWPVETHSAKRLTTDMLAYQAQKPGISRAEALRQAMLRLLDTGVYKDPDTGEIRYSYGHPIFWAPFSLVGEGG
ncbi:MAG: CHAT domain-containing protein, partial [Desulfobacterales bacterium]|nr:CHAT domain-containing protein [Desulfobacterales bacterium]